MLFHFFSLKWLKYSSHLRYVGNLVTSVTLSSEFKCVFNYLAGYFSIYQECEFPHQDKFSHENNNIDVFLRCSLKKSHGLLRTVMMKTLT